MSSTAELASGVRQALEREGTVRIAVHSETQVELGKIAAGRMASSPEAAANLTFEIIPIDEQGQYPVGAILAP